MPLIPPKLVDALADRYTFERELGAGGMATELVTEVTARLKSLKRHEPCRHPGESRGPLNMDSGLRRNDGQIIDWMPH